MHWVSPLEPWWLRLVIALIVFPIGGLGWAAYVWKRSEAAYGQSGRTRACALAGSGSN
ncbi:hypothetical protein [Shewanella sp. GXUN23E]|uniref:hypothetical protein n=1 Tax=Shewanella sp. GXUN23E TaxID=3422498 RepID=UPI003D7E9A76